MQQPERVYVDISWRALFKIVALVVGLFAIIMLRDVLVMLFAVFILVAALNPTVNRLQEYMSRPLAVTLLYVILLASLGVISYLLIPAFIQQLNDLIRAIPTIADRVRPYILGIQNGEHPQLLDQAIGSLTGTLQGVSNNLLQTTYGLVGSVATLLTGFVISFYLLLEEENARDFFRQVLPHNRYEVAYQTISKISDRMGSWVRGQLLLMLIIGLSNLVVYLVLGVPTPLPLAVWAGLSELVPVVGPIIGVIPAVVVSLVAGNYVQALLVLVLGFLLLQQLEAHFIVPRVMGRAVGLSPVLVIISLLIGAKLLGLVGALLAVPTAAVIAVLVGEMPALRKVWESSTTD